MQAKTLSIGVLPAGAVTATTDPVTRGVEFLDGLLLTESGLSDTTGALPKNQYLIGRGRSMKNSFSAVYPDAAVETLITSIGVTATHGKTGYRVLIGALKKAGVWSSLTNGFLFGSAYQPSAEKIKSITGGTDATGSGTHSSFYTTLNGTSNGYTYTQTGNVTETARTIVAVFLDNNTGDGHVSHIWSAYSGGSSKGPALFSGGSSVSGSSSSTVNRVYVYGAVDSSGATSAEPAVASATCRKKVFSALRIKDGRIEAHVVGRDAKSLTLASVWNNATTVGIGMNPSSGVRLAGRLYAVLDFGVALTDEQLASVMLVLRYLTGVTDSGERAVVFNGNSLTAAASGGGIPWPEKLLAKTRWSSAFALSQYTNNALSGAWETAHGEADYYIRSRALSPVASERSILFVWGGVNDITANVPTASIIGALDRHITAAYEDGFDVYVLPITPVAPTSAGLAYGYTAEQLKKIEDVNSYLKHYATARARYVDLYKIGDAHPSFLDPTSSDYYVTGDGLHHNDAGRALIADFVDSVVAL